MRPDGSYSDFKDLQEALRKGDVSASILHGADPGGVRTLCDLAKWTRGYFSDFTPMRGAFALRQVEIFAIMLEVEAALEDEESDHTHDLLCHVVDFHQLPAGTQDHQRAMIKMLLQKPGSRVNRVDRDVHGRSVLHTAAGRGDVNIVSLLLADPNVDVSIHRRNGHRETELHDATYSWRPAVVKALSPAPGVDWKAVSDGGTPEEIAKRYNYGEIVELLQDSAKQHE